MSMKKTIMIGYFKETAELCRRCGFEIAGVVDRNPRGGDIFLGDDAFFRENFEKYLDCTLVITPDNPRIRRRLYHDYKALGFTMQTLIAPEAVVSSSAYIGEGCIIQSQCHISSDVCLGKCVRANVAANIMHNVEIDDFATVAPCACLLGYVAIGAGAYIGANSTILPYKHVGADAVVGAGAVVTKDVCIKETVVGVPAKAIDKKL